MHLIYEIQTKLQSIQRIRKKAQQDLLQSTAGNRRLRVIKNHNTWQYYLITGKGDSNGTYLPVGQRGTAQEIAQRDYAQHVTDVTTVWEGKLQAAKELLSAIPEDHVQALINPPHLHPGRAPLITSYGQTDAEFAAEWQKKPYLSPIVVSGFVPNLRK